MRLGKPFTPVLRQHHGNNSNGRERPGERFSSARLTAEQRAKQEAWNEVCLNHDELSSSAPLSARSSAGSTKASSLTRQGRRSNRGIFNSRGGRVVGCSSSTGGTGSGTGLGGVSALSSFWSHIDDLDQDLQHRAAQLKNKGQSKCVSTPTEATFPATPDMSSKDVSFAETPETNDMFVVDGPEVSFFDHRGITDAEFVCMEGSLNLDDCCGNSSRNSNKVSKQESSPSNWLADLPVATTLLEGSSFEPPVVNSALSSPDVSSSAFRDSPQTLRRNAKTPAYQAPPAQRSRAYTTPSSFGTGVRTPRGSSTGLGRGSGRVPSGGKSDGVIDHMTRRIRQLEGELEQALDALGTQQPAEKRLPRRSGSAPPARRQAHNSSASTMPVPAARSLLTGSPQATPRIMCRETLTESEGAHGLDPGAFLFNAARNRFATADRDSGASSPSRLAHICQMMQAERKSFLDTLHEVCNEVGVAVESECALTESKTCEPRDKSQVASPRLLISRLRDAHFALSARVARGESKARDQPCATSAEMCALVDENTFLACQVEEAKEPKERSYSSADSGCNETAKASVIADDVHASRVRPLAGAIAAVRSLLLEADDIRKAYDDLNEDDRGDLKELAKCIANVDSKLFVDGGLLSGTSEVAVPLAEKLVVDKVLRAVPRSNTPDMWSAAPTSLEQGGQSLTRGSPQSSCGSLPAVGRLSELVDEKQREVIELQERLDRASVSSEEHLEASTLLASSREELRLLREFLGTTSEGVEQDC